MRAANRHGILFLGECDVHNMLPENDGAKVASTLRMLRGADVVATELYIDVFSGHTSQQTLTDRSPLRSHAATPP